MNEQQIDIIQQLDDIKDKLKSPFHSEKSHRSILGKLDQIIDDYNLPGNLKLVIQQNQNLVGNRASATRFINIIADIKNELAKLGYRKQPTASLSVYPPVFVSHASEDRTIADCIIDKFLLKTLNITKDDIYYTSRPDTGPPIGDDWLPNILKHLKEAKVVLFIITPTFNKKVMCLNEVGAAWGLEKEIFQFIVPPITFADLSPAIKGKQAMNISEREGLGAFITQLSKKNLVIKPRNLTNPALSKIIKGFLTSFDKVLRSKYYGLPEGFYHHNNSVFFFDKESLRKIPNIETALLLGLEESPTTLSNEEFKELPKGKDLDNVKKAKIFQVRDNVTKWVWLNGQLRGIPNPDTRKFIALFNKGAEAAIDLSSEAIDLVPKGAALESVPGDPKNWLKDYEKIVAMFSKRTFIVTTGKNDSDNNNDDTPKIYGFA